VGEAGNGEEAIQMVNQLDPAVLLMDINMPKMNGIEATKKLWSGAVQLITKEAAVEQLYDAIQKAMNKRKRMG
jgi:DNA-binding NarL/FixJ family response regulator